VKRVGGWAADRHGRKKGVSFGAGGAEEDKKGKTARRGKRQNDEVCGGKKSGVAFNIKKDWGPLNVVKHQKESSGRDAR